MKWKWLAVFLFGLFIAAFVIYLILNPEVNELNEATRAKLGGSYIKLSDGITQYKLEGPQDAKVVVLVHGATIPIWTWDKLIPALTEAGFRVLSYDNFGIPVLGEFLARLAGIRVITNRFVSLIENHPESENYTRLFAEQTTYKGFQQSILSMLRNNAIGDYRPAYQILGRQKRDVLLIWGTDDTGVTKPMVSDIQSLVPRLTFKPVEDVGHGIVFQKPEIVNALITGFLIK